MKRRMCECSGCRKMAKVKTQHGHWICEDHAKMIRRRKKAHQPTTHIWKEKVIGHIGDLTIYTDYPVKI